MHKLPHETISAIVEPSPIGMLLVGSDGRIVFANRRCEQLFGYPVEELAGAAVEMLIPERFRAHHVSLREKFAGRPKPRPMGAGALLHGLRKEGHQLTIEVGLSPVSIGNERMILASVLDVSDRVLVGDLKRENQSLQLEATHDDLTGLPNRRFFMELFERLSHVASRRGDSVTMMYVDLDRFKEVNDRYGHDVGDQLLQEVAELLRTNIRTGDILGRTGGDEFLISLIDTRDSEGAKGVADKLITKISEITYIVPHPIEISVSIGAVRATEARRVVTNDFIKAADQLMYEAKQDGGGRALLRTYTQPVSPHHAR